MDSLRDRLAEVRSRARQVMLTSGLSLLVTVLLGAILVIGFSDWLTHYSDWSLLRFLAQPFDDPAVRVMVSLTLLVTAVFIIWRALVRPLSHPLPDIDLALRVEGRHPELKDSFASAVNFLSAGIDPHVGSTALQKSVIRRTLEAIERIDFLEIIDTRRMRLLATVALGVLLLSTGVVAANRSATWIALQRLAFPLSAPEWPRRTNLRLLNPEFRILDAKPDVPLRIARGDTLQLLIENSLGHLPGDVRLQYRVGDGKLQTEPLRPQSLRDAAGNVREVAAATIQGVRGPIQFRVVGGDHNDMPYLTLLVIPAPTAEAFQVTVVPPSYTRKKMESLPEGVGQIEAFVGSKVEITARLSKPARWAALKLKDQKPRAVEMAEDRKSLTARFVIEQPGVDSWWLDLQDDEGFQNVEVARYEIRGIPDQTPDVLLEVPVTDLQVTPEAEIQVKASARDDLGLREMRLVWSDAESTSQMMGEAAAARRTEIIPLFDGEGRPQQHVVEFTWKLADLKKQAGDEVVFHVEALDDCDVGIPHVGRSTPRRLTFVAPEQKGNELTERQAGLLDDLERAFKLQEESLAQVNELRLQLDKAGKLRPEDVDALQRVELAQRQLSRQLTDPGDGLEKRARDILQELHANKLKSPETENRVSHLSSEIRRLAEENLPHIEDELTAARKLAQGLPPDPATPPKTPARPTPGDAKSLSNQPSKDPSTNGNKKTDPQQDGQPGSDKPDDQKPDDQKPDDQKPGDEKPGDEKPGDEKPGETKPSDAKPGDSADKPMEPASKGTASQPKGDRPQGPLDRAAENQQAVKESLGEMLQQLAQWRNERDAVRELTDVMSEQEELRKQAAEVGQKTVNKGPEQLTPQERADLAKLAERQRKQADKLDQLQNRIEDTARRLENQEPGTGETFDEAVRHAREQSVSERMRDAANSLDENQTGKALQTQQEAMDKLKEMDDILRNRRESDAETMVKKLKQAEEELQKLGDQQEELMKKRKEAEQLTDANERAEALKKIDEEQEQVQEELAKLSRRLQRMQAKDAADAAQRAASRLRKSRENQQDGQEDEAAEEEREALDDIEQAKKELAAEREEAEETLAQQQLLRIATQLKALIPRQQELIAETLRLENLRNGGEWTRPQLQTLLTLSRSQRQLKEETDELTQTLTAAEVYALAMKGAARQMEKAADRLGERDTGSLTVRAQEAARKRFEELVASLKPEKIDPAAKPQEQEGGNQGPGEKPSAAPTDGIPLLSQLRMLRTLQIELNERLQEIAGSREQGAELTPDQKSELAEIASEQGQVADLARNLTEQAARMHGQETEPEEEKKEDGVKTE